MEKSAESTNKSVEESGFEALSIDRELAEYIKNQIIYTGLFINPDDLYSIIPSHLAHRIRDPHVTVAYRPEANRVLLDSLGSKASIRAVAYGNNGANEGLLVEVSAEDPAIQKALEDRIAPDNRTGEIKKVPMHITLSIAEGAEAVNTKNLDFMPLDNPINLTGSYKLFGKDGTLISDKETIQKMQDNGVSMQEVDDPDRL